MWHMRASIRRGTGSGRKSRHPRMHAPTLTTCSPERRIQAAHSRYPPLCAAEGRPMVCNVLELCGCIRSCAAAQRRRPTCARPGAAAATCSRCWRCWPWPCGQLPVGVRCLEATPSWSTAAVPRRHAGAVAQPQSSATCSPALSSQPRLSYSMLMDGRESVVGQSEALAYSRPTPVDTFIRTL